MEISQWSHNEGLNMQTWISVITNRNWFIVLNNLIQKLTYKIMIITVNNQKNEMIY